MKRVYHPLLFSIYFPLSLYSLNIRFVSAVELFLPWTLLLSFTGIIWWIVHRKVRDIYVSGMIATFSLLIMFFYGIIYNIFMKVIWVFKKALLKGLFFLPDIFSVICVFLVVLLLWKLLPLFFSHKYFVTNLLNTASLILLFLPLPRIISWKMKERETWGWEFSKKEINIKAKRNIKMDYLPNIYYIILDGYAGEKTLKEIYHFDNSEFLNFLKGKGFYIASESRSNYCQTLLSLASLLNFQYIDSLLPPSALSSENVHLLEELIKHNIAFSFLKNNGYTTIAMDACVWEPAQITSADVFYHLSPFFLSYFQEILIEITPLRFLFSFIRRLAGEGVDEYYRHRKRLLKGFELVKKIAQKNEGPFILFAHFLLPHQPFVFDRNGNPSHLHPSAFTIWRVPESPVEKEIYRKGYIEQLIFTNKKVSEMIEHILKYSKKPPIIILQADHGPASMLDPYSLERTNINERFYILNAYYLPYGGDSLLYPSISPVNTFRVIFNHYFGTSLLLLHDRSFYSTWDYPFHFHDITDRLN